MPCCAMYKVIFLGVFIGFAAVANANEQNGDIIFPSDDYDFKFEHLKPRINVDENDENEKYDQFDTPDQEVDIFDSNAQNTKTSEKLRFFNRNCLYPQFPKNGRISCSAKGCKGFCKPGFQFSTGKTQVKLNCVGNKWYADDVEWTKNEICSRSCYPPCENGGQCNSFGECECSPGFSGPLCAIKVLHPTTVRSYDQNIDWPQQSRTRSCYTWGGRHYISFDEKIFSFDSRCTHTLIREPRDELFTVNIENSQGCESPDKGRCFRILKIYIQDDKYTFSVNETGSIEFRDGKKLLPIPAKMPFLSIEKNAHFVVISIDIVSLVINWDGGLFVQVQAPEELWTRTTGLCGTMSGGLCDGLTKMEWYSPRCVEMLAKNCQVSEIGEICMMEPIMDYTCPSRDMEIEAKNFCFELLHHKQCSMFIDVIELEKACKWDYCSCQDSDRKHCACNTMDVYMRQCANKEIADVSGWRTEKTCPMKCENGKVYMACGPKSQPSCGTEMSVITNDALKCEEGCFCPLATVVHNGTCISEKDCPCQWRGRFYPSGESVPNDCNMCTCSSGKWICTEHVCNGRCTIVGDPHYETFDGRRYDFMGKCSYYLMKGYNYSIEAENVACPSTMSEMMGYPSSMSHDKPSCTKTVTIRSLDAIIKLKQHHQIVINGEDVLLKHLPHVIGNVRIRIASSIYIVAELDAGIEVWWDGLARVDVIAPPQFRGKTKGLCGTFTSNQQTDFLTPDGDVEQSVIAFANKWKTNENCPDVTMDFEKPCDINPQKKESAKEQYCSVLLKKLFSDCHTLVDVEPYFKNCMFDMCACESDVKTCLCPTIGAYARECARLGVYVPWRSEVVQCQVQCPEDQEYQICGNSCTRSCADISFYEDCKMECVEGCNCPIDQTLDEFGRCIPISQCPCTRLGLDYPPGYKAVRPGVKSEVLCTCENALWNCLPIMPADSELLPREPDLTNLCSATKHMVVTTCQPLAPRTCRNMHEYVMETSEECKPGCVCMRGYVLDSSTGQCTKIEDCPCYHGGRSYSEGTAMKEECNSCTCESGRWNCSNHTCPGICSVFGDSHFKTFDGKHFEFHGVCDYVLVKGKLSRDEFFDVSTRNDHCGTTGVSCSKSVTLTIGGRDPSSSESVTLTKGKKLPTTTFKRIAVRRAGLFVFLDIPDLEIVVQWDEGTRVYVRLNPKWKGLTRGLCGDYNGNAEDDFKTPSGGVIEVSPTVFGDSWKKNDACPESKEIIDTCSKHPERSLWAAEKCGILKSEIFKPCHTEVDIGPYEEKCIFDTCGCDTGGDCECLCTVLAAYAHECNSRGVPIAWRSQKLCPMQCEKLGGYYNPCIASCPLETCENSATLEDSSHLCDQDTCVEGCLPKVCAPNYIFLNNSYTECIPKEKCKPVCQIIDGKEYFEGDRIPGDDCHSCFCSRKQIVCSDLPCTTTGSIMDDPNECIEGWTGWFNRDLPTKNIDKMVEKEPLPTPQELLTMPKTAICRKDQMTDVRCRTVAGKIDAKASGLDAECSLERGLYCQSMFTGVPCEDFEISVRCNCNKTSEMVNCDLNDPIQPQATKCNTYLECIAEERGPKLVEKTCLKGMFFNPVRKSCDLPLDVLIVKPECKSEMQHYLNKTNGYFDNKTTTATSFTASWTTPAPRVCRVCEGVFSVNTTECMCEEPEYWDGISCVLKYYCPCIVGFVRYPVGSTYVTANCEQCQCSSGGDSICKPKTCEPCDGEGLQAVMTELCSCVCKPCKSGTRLCPTDNICVDEKAWCDGLHDCSDDEKDCITTTQEPTTLKPIDEQKCHKDCPPGYTALLKTKTTNTKSNPYTRYKGKKGGRPNNTHSSPTKTKAPPPPLKANGKWKIPQPECEQYTCVIDKPTDPGEVCPLAVCPKGWDIVYESVNIYRKSNACPKYNCIPPPSVEHVCSFTGRTLSTFDNFVYQYDICSHILARDRDANLWYIVVDKNCNIAEHITCNLSLMIHFGEHEVFLLSDGSVVIDGLRYGPNEVKHFGNRHPFVKLSLCSNVLFFKATKYPFTIIFELDSTIKVIVNQQTAGHVDGLCGYFDGDSENDKQMPDGWIAKNIQQFGDSWQIDGAPRCEARICPEDLHREAWKICNTVNDRSMAGCSDVINVEKFVSVCLENTCNCLDNVNSTKEDCRCRALTSFVKDCQSTDKNVDLSTWRSAHDCPAPCKAPFVHNDCFRHKCESSCENLQEIEPCPAVDGICVSGCFCPEGTVRKGDSCVLATECRDCVCNGFGDSKFIAFDQKSITFDGNCTYILSRDIADNVKGIQGKHSYEVFVTNAACGDRICTEAITIRYRESNVVQIKRDPSHTTLMTFVDGDLIEKFPHKTSWLTLETNSDHDINLLIPAIQLEVIGFQHNFAFSVRLPSHSFSGQMEGICGNCNANDEDDLRKPDGDLADDVQEFSNSWLAMDLPTDLGFNNEHCENPTVTNCTQNPNVPAEACEVILDYFGKFGRCHDLVDPTPYYSDCKARICAGGNICDSLESYARMCLHTTGICIDWRTHDCLYLCPPHLQYQACGSSCTDTCEEISNAVDKTCAMGLTEGCYCPNDYVLYNDTCVPQNQCFICDDEGHIIGDVWLRDNCTECMCSSEKIVTCVNQKCSKVDIICEEFWNTIVVPGTENDCCPKYTCVPPTNACVFVSSHSNDIFQSNKTSLKSIGETWQDGDCKTCACELFNDVPKSTCSVQQCLVLHDHPDYDEFELDILNEYLCCPKYERIACKHNGHVYKPGEKWNPTGDSCLTMECYKDDGVLKKREVTQECNAYCDLGFEYVESLNKSWTCCGKCMPMSCVVDGEEKPIDHEWYSEDHCTKYTCLLVNETIYIKEQKETCPEIDSFDENNYKLEYRQIDGKCCPEVVKTACIFDGEIYEPGQQRKSSIDNCIVELCEDSVNGTMRNMKIVTCNKECPMGWEYEEPDPISGECCGNCKQMYCVIGDVTYKPGSTWKSEDNCSILGCEKNGDQLLVSRSAPVCPDLTDCPKDSIYTDGCCQYCNITSSNQKNCEIRTLDPIENKEIFVKYRGNRIACKIIDPMKLTECVGHCESSMTLDLFAWKQINNCHCCQPKTFKVTLVQLACEGGHNFIKHLKIADSCSCSSCSAGNEESKNISMFMKR